MSLKLLIDKLVYIGAVSVLPQHIHPLGVPSQLACVTFQLFILLLQIIGKRHFLYPSIPLLDPFRVLVGPLNFVQQVIVYVLFDDVVGFF